MIKLLFRVAFQAAPAPVKLFQSPALSRLIPFEREAAPVSHSPPQARVYAPQAPAAPAAQVQPRSPQPQLSPLPKAFSPQPPQSPQTQTFPPPFPEPYSTFPRKTQSSFAPVSPRAFAPLPPQAHEPRSLSAVTSQVYAPVPPPSLDFALVSPQPYHSPVSAPSAPFKFGATRDEQPGAPSTYIIPIQVCGVSQQTNITCVTPGHMSTQLYSSPIGFKHSSMFLRTVDISHSGHSLSKQI